MDCFPTDHILRTSLTFVSRDKTSCGLFDFKIEVNRKESSAGVYNSSEFYLSQIWCKQYVITWYFI